jgi:hypothetical protein
VVAIDKNCPKKNIEHQLLNRYLHRLGGFAVTRWPDGQITSDFPK